MLGVVIVLILPMIGAAVLYGLGKLLGDLDLATVLGMIFG